MMGYTAPFPLPHAFGVVTVQEVLPLLLPLLVQTGFEPALVRSDAKIRCGTITDKRCSELVR